MNKITGQELKTNYLITKNKLNNLEYKINKKFELIVEDYRKYISNEHKDFLENTSIYDLEIPIKLEIIIQTESNYIQQTSNQLDLFK